MESQYSRIICLVVVLMGMNLLQTCAQDTPTKVFETGDTLVIKEEVPSLIDPAGQTIRTRIKVPLGFERIAVETTTFASFLAEFPVKRDGSKVKLFNGEDKPNQSAHAALFAIDTGTRDLQQCADAVMRLRAEYLWAQARYGDIQFNFTNGFVATYSKWRQGQRIKVSGNQVQWVPTQSVSDSYTSFRKYLDMVFAYAGTQSLSQELVSQSMDSIEIGDVFIRGGFPGHAVLVVDKAIHPETEEVIVLLAQSYMPAQDIHIINNLDRPAISPWYAVRDFGKTVKTAEWIFYPNELMRFPNERSE